MTPCTYEIKILRYLNGEEILDLMWGAAMGEAIEQLRGGGYIRREGVNHVITEKGKAALEESKHDPR